MRLSNSIECIAAVPGKTNGRLWSSFDGLDPISEQIVRGAMILRVNSALTDKTGVQPALLDAILELYHADLIPEVRLFGSLGCAGLGLMG